jgi:hypothetical protein
MNKVHDEEISELVQKASKRLDEYQDLMKGLGMGKDDAFNMFIIVELSEIKKEIRKLSEPKRILGLGPR